MLTFILNVLGEVLGIEKLYCTPFYSAGSGPRERPKIDIWRDQGTFKTIFEVVLGNSGRPLPPLFVEQTPTAHLVDGHKDSFETALNRSST